MKVLYLEDLEDSVAHGCSDPACDHKHDGPLFLHPRCHLYGRLDASFQFGESYIEMVCSVCHEIVMRLQIASKGRKEV